MKIKTQIELEHGGNLASAIERHGEHPKGWLDMSTGISPWSWPIPAIDPQLWQQLPSNAHELINVAKNHYAVSKANLALTPGSQLSIRLVPHLLTPSTVAIPLIGYQEHGYSWQMAGHQLVYYRNFDELMTLAAANKMQHAVVINPNNPTGETIELPMLAKLSELISGSLLVDEAFADVAGQASASSLKLSRVIVFKSVGKFFGLAGLRVGFVIANDEIVRSLNALLEPWSVSTPSIDIARQALSDTQWQQQQRQRIVRHAKNFKPAIAYLVQKYCLDHSTHSGLFHTVFGAKEQIDQLHSELAQSGVWARKYNATDSMYWLRLSLPKDLNEFSARIGFAE